MKAPTIKSSTGKTPKPSFDLPGFGEWQDDIYRGQVEASIYFDTLELGRGVTLGGRVSFVIGGPYGYEGPQWRPSGCYLYRVVSDSVLEGQGLKVTDSQQSRAYAVGRELLPEIDGLSALNALRLEIAKTEVLRRHGDAKATYERELKRTLKLAYKFEQWLGVETGTIHRTAYAEHGRKHCESDH